MNAEAATIAKVVGYFRHRALKCRHAMNVVGISDEAMDTNNRMIGAWLGLADLFESGEWAKEEAAPAKPQQNPS